MLVHIIDDDPAVARTVARSARQGGWEAVTYSSADEFLDRMDQAAIGCIVSDIRMPGTSGLELIERLHDQCPEWPVVIMTGFAEVTAAIRCFRHGAVHFLQKPFKPTELLACLSEAAEIGTRRRAEADRQQRSRAVQALTAREKEVLSAFAQGRQSKNIAWDLRISIRTVEMHRSNILAKLDARNTSQAVGLLQMAGTA